MIKFTISSHIEYIEKTEKYIYNSLINSGINNNDIYIFVGGYDKDSGYKRLDPFKNKYSSPHNSLDFTGLISILELNLQNSADLWFLLHDTCFVGLRFYEYVKNFDYNNKPYVRLTCDDVSMNMGSYSSNYLNSISEDILKYKNNSDIQKYKTLLINNEDIFIPSKDFCYSTTPRATYPAIDFFKNNTPRIIEYFSDVDLYKIKANWKIKKEYTIKL